MWSGRRCQGGRARSGWRAEVAQALGHGQHPLAKRQRRQAGVNEMGRRGHAPGVARGAHAPVLVNGGLSDDYVAAANGWSWPGTAGQHNETYVE